MQCCYKRKFLIPLFRYSIFRVLLCPNFKSFPGFKLSGRDKTGVKTKVTSKSLNSIVGTTSLAFCAP